MHTDKPPKGGRWLAGSAVLLFSLSTVVGILWAWWSMRGTPIPDSDPIELVSYPETVHGPNVRETYRHEMEREGGPCPHPIRVVSFRDVPEVMESLGPDVPAWLQPPADIMLYTDTWAHMRVYLHPDTVSVGDEVPILDVPCKLLQWVTAEHNGLRLALANDKAGWTGEVPVVIGPVLYQPIEVVRASDGAPVPHALVTARGRDSLRTDALGRVEVPISLFSLYQPPSPEKLLDSRRRFDVYAQGFEVARIRVGQEVSTSAVLDPVRVELEAGHFVSVDCVGEDIERCPGDLVCGSSWDILDLQQCKRPPDGLDWGDDSTLLCSCPETDAVLRGMGRTHAVPDDQDHVVLDFMAGASVTGRLSEPARCRAHAERVAAEVADLGNIGELGQVRGSCDGRTGEFSVRGLGPGDWIVSVQAGLDHGGIAVPVAGLDSDEARDVGTVDVDSGSALLIYCHDGLTDQDVDGSQYAFARHHSPDMEVGHALAVRCGSRVQPALPGEWTVWRLPWVHHSERVYVPPGRAAEVVFSVGDDRDIQALGARLAQSNHGLEVVSVSPGSPLQGAGLQTGDTIVDLRVAGWTVPMANESTDVLSGVLGIWGSTGVEVFVSPVGGGDGRWIPLDDDG